METSKLLALYNEQVSGPDRAEANDLPTGQSK